MAASKPAASPPAAASTAEEVRRRVEAGGERLWRLADFPDLPFPSAVAKTLARLAASQHLRRLSRGVYYRARPTTFGESLPNPAALQQLASERAPVFPAGLAAANLLGFSTQSPRTPEVATTATSLPRALLGASTVVHTRRPKAWAQLTREDAALLDFLRERGRTSELSAEATTQRVLAQLGDGDRFARLVRVAATEPPRVRALLGALGQVLRASDALLVDLRRSLHPLSRFEFGVFDVLSSAAAWQAKTRRAA